MARKQHRKTFLAEWREIAQLTQEAAAERLGITAGHLSNVERGLRQYTQELLEGAADLYGCEPADLLTIDPTGPDGQRSLLATLGRVPSEQRAVAERMLRGLIEPANSTDPAPKRPAAKHRRRVKA